MIETMKSRKLQNIKIPTQGEAAKNLYDLKEYAPEKLIDIKDYAAHWKV